MRKRESRQLQSKTEVIEALGGERAVAALTGASYKIVENWKREKKIPGKYYPVMIHALRRKRLNAPDTLWNVVTPAMRRAEIGDKIAQQRARMAS